ncbi:MAG: translation initiation factor IF-3 [Saprospiraceae bacterium]|jgi:translation initiation factor IF-3|nr:translation initiation factor IF-3 [Saprospiraceae bacterium]
MPQKPVELEHRINDLIRVPEVRIIGDALEELSEKLGEKIEPGIYPTRKALIWAEDLQLDLIEISPNANPPVCRITDYNKFLYQKKKRDKELKSNSVKTVIKEIRFGPNTDDHDLDFKIKHAISFLKEGSKVKAYVQFKGRAIVFQDRGQLLLLKFLKEIEEFGVADSLPKMEGRRMIVMVSPKKVAPKKKE